MGVVAGLGEGEELRLKMGVAGEKGGPLLRGGDGGAAFQGKVVCPDHALNPLRPPPLPCARISFPLPGSCDLNWPVLTTVAPSQILFNYAAPPLSPGPPKSPGGEVIEIPDGSPQRHPPRGSVDASPKTVPKTVRACKPSQRVRDRDDVHPLPPAKSRKVAERAASPEIAPDPVTAEAYLWVVMHVEKAVAAPKAAAAPRAPKGDAPVRLFVRGPARLIAKVCPHPLLLRR